jgi:hypothetical protein
MEMIGLDYTLAKTKRQMLFDGKPILIDQIPRSNYSLLVRAVLLVAIVAQHERLE